ncbi:YbaB/EbfC family nucleoid-associated protein [Nocardia sp. NPDC049149]|uniref:YbaB/EbfC family nucleoid-associated protein n=1 Tax=Nocardia sp. NPDC049149 TaxID=3364315 RepID=UPI0037169EE3
MAFEIASAQFTEMMESVHKSIKSMARSQQEQARLTATAYAAGKRVAVVVNARGVVIETRFTADIADLTPKELAAAVTAAAQDAAGQVERKTREMIQELRDEQARLPRLSEIVPGLPDVEDMMPKMPEVSTAPPSARSRARAEGESVDGTMEFTDVVPLDETRPDRPGSGVAESGW